MATHHASSAASPGSGVTVIATDRGWHGSRADLARLLATRFGLESADVSASLESSNRVEVAFGVTPKDAETLREVLERIGVTALLESPPPQPTIRADQLRPSRRPPETANTMLDLRGHSSKVMTAPPRPRNTMAGGWAKRRDTPKPKPAVIGETGLSLGAGLAIAPSGNTPSGGLQTRESPPPPRIAPTPAPTTIDPPRTAFRGFGDAPGLDGDISDAWDQFVGHELDEPTSQSLPPIEEEPPTLVSSRTPELPAMPSAAGWAAVLGEQAPERTVPPTQPMPMPTPEPMPAQPQVYDRTDQWEITIESSDQNGGAEDPEDLFNTQVNDVSHLMAGAAALGANNATVTELPRIDPTPLVPAPQPPTDLPHPTPLRTPPTDFAAFSAAAMPGNSGVHKAETQAEPPPKHNPVMATLLSAFFPGSGQVYNGHVLKGIAIGLGFWLIAPWIYGIVDAFKTAKAIQAGKQKSKGKGAPLHALAYTALWLPALIASAFAINSAITAPEAYEPPDEAKIRDNLIKARGEVTVEFEKALYQAQKAIVNVEPCAPGRDCPGDPCYDKSASICDRIARGLANDARSACGKKDWVLCKQKGEEARALDPNNRNALGHIIEATKHLPVPAMLDATP